MSRSGNHSIINWMIRQMEGTYCYLNCAEPKMNPFDTARPLSEEGFTYQTNIPEFRLDEEQKGRFSQKDHLLVSYEDCFLGPLAHPVYEQNHDGWVGSSAERVDVLVLRDPLNLLASRKKAGLLNGHYTHHGSRPISDTVLKKIYKQHARQFAGEKKYLKNKLVTVSYNRWVTDKSYRQAIAEQLGLHFSDAGINEVMEVAGGSSFDGTSFHQAAQKMDVLNRWVHYMDDQQYLQLLDLELMKTGKVLFNQYLDWEGLQRQVPKEQKAEVIRAAGRKALKRK